MTRAPDHRRSRVRRIAAKRPAVTVRATYRPRTGAVDELAAILIELLDLRIRSGRG